MTDGVPGFLRIFPRVRELWEELESARARCDLAIAERNSARAAAQAALAARDAALVDVDSARAAAQAALDARGAALAERDAAQAVAQAAADARDAALADRDTARADQRMARAESETLRNEIAALIWTLPSEIGEAAEEGACSIKEMRPRGADKAIIVPVRGPIAKRELRVTQPFFEEYCRTIGADLRIVDIPENIPSLRTRAALAPFACEYRRFALVDPNVLIRDGCPDLFAAVPEGEIGAVSEGRWIERNQDCAELARMYGRGDPMAPHQYVETGLLVMSAEHLTLLEALAQSPLVTHPRDEQGFINAMIYRDSLPLYLLPREFNWVPYRTEEFDWRWSWVFHMADTWRSPPRTDSAWRLHSQAGNSVATQVALSPVHCRLPCLIEVAEQMRGGDVRMFHPADLSYHVPIARLCLTADDAAVMWCEAGIRADFAGLRDSPPIYGPYVGLPAGRWLVTLLGADGQSHADEGIVLDVVHDSGNEAIRKPAAIGPHASFEIYLENDINDLEVRIYRIDRDFSIGLFAFRRIGD